MSDQTVLKPQPGRRKKAASSPESTLSNSGDLNQTVLVMQANKGANAHRLPSLGENPLVDQASSILSLIGQMRSTHDHNDVGFLRQTCIEKIRDYENQLRGLAVSSEDIEAARYCLCSFLDETVMNTPWGERSVWRSESLLSVFHAETWGGEYFYSLLDKALLTPHQSYQLLELQHLCLALGFTGKLRIAERGEDKLQAYRSQVFEALTQVRGSHNKLLSPKWQDNVQAGSETHEGIPLWVTGSFFGLLLLAMYMGFSYHINAYSNQAFQSLSTLVPLHVESEEVEYYQDPAALKLQQLLQSEVERGLLEFESHPDRIRLVIKSSELFASGSNEVQASVMPLLSKIARALESTTGRIMIVGHTDDRPIFTSKYPSNWHLSLARATAVANVLAMGTELRGRLWPEGQGDANPRLPNTSDVNRASNRRVEIDLLYQQRRAEK
ncbi:type IV secretion protein DotU [Photobacterium jeanii]|uniref:Type IV secretion protein DotU n=1 Tax=Photobacterium jeanii TaxID=858640 RepID=A0A178K1S4_9GAMM|nr:type VI secretion system protein TssL, long form [Photobacterium jeanii]OAN11056.1 type IV secretion protein DotU [Photobacterium jeanii]PST90570.1 type VI secretion system protein TssL [Photobacterium jeanii]